MSFGHDLVSLLLEMNVINREDAERRIRILAARLHDPRAARWFLNAGRHAVNNFDQIVDQPYNPEPKQWWAQAGYKENNTPFGPADPERVPASRLSKNLLAMVHSRGPYGDKRPAWWQSMEPVPEEDPAFTSGLERPPMAADDPRLAGMSPEDAEAYREGYNLRSGARRLSDLEPVEVRWQRLQQKLAKGGGKNKAVRPSSQQPDERKAAVAAAGKAVKQAQTALDAARAAGDAAAEKQALADRQRARAELERLLKTSATESVRRLVCHIVEAAEETANVSPENQKKNLKQTLASLNIKGDIEDSDAPNILRLKTDDRSVLAPASRAALRKGGFSIEHPKPVDGAYLVRFTPRYQTRLHQPRWQARTLHTLTLEKAMSALRVKSYSLENAGPAGSYNLKLSAADRKKVQSDKGIELLSRAGYVIDNTRQDAPAGVLPVTRLDAEFEPYKGSDLKTFRHGQQPPAKGWREIRAPKWATVAAQSQDEAPTFFRTQRHEERNFWQKMEWVVIYLNKLYRDTQNTSTPTAKVHADLAEKFLNELSATAASDTDKFLNVIDRAVEFERTVPDIVQSQKNNNAAVVARYGPYTLIRLNSVEAVYNHSARTTKWLDGQRPTWCTGDPNGRGLNMSATYLKSGEGRMYMVDKDGESFALLTPGHCFNDVYNIAVTDVAYFDQFIPLFDQFPVSFFDVKPESNYKANAETFKQSALERRKKHPST